LEYETVLGKQTKSFALNEHTLKSISVRELEAYNSLLVKKRPTGLKTTPPKTQLNASESLRMEFKVRHPAIFRYIMICYSWLLFFFKKKFDSSDRAGPPREVYEEMGPLIATIKQNNRDKIVSKVKVEFDEDASAYVWKTEPFGAAGSYTLHVACEDDHGLNIAPYTITVSVKSGEPAVLLLQVRQ
jgi:hypothetical protein